ncbi:hypothetical protein [Collimonas silvisoli]|uniref:hypothetical protein n=1 Tax=Collimonas silvisoli TaxID=2825884 RepID=UPI001E5B1D48|nr:hypothetical protein [Collimonas silvisoli]
MASAVSGWLIRAPVRASEDTQDLGEQDVVIIAVKGPALSSVAQGIAPCWDRTLSFCLP